MVINILSIIGPAAVGKGTLAKYLATQLSMFAISTGDILREMAKADEQTAALLTTGELLPDRFLRQPVLKNLYGRSPSGLILDGYPRTAEQAAMLGIHIQTEMAKQQPKWHAIILEASPDTIRNRLATREKREDDAKLDKRMNDYQEEISDLKAMLRMLKVPGIIINTDSLNAQQVYQATIRGIFHGENNLATR